MGHVEWLGHKGMMYRRDRTDVDKKKKVGAYVDLTAGGIFCCMFGVTWKKFQKRYDESFIHHLYTSKFSNYWNERYKESLRELTGFTSFVVYTSGTEAVEAFLRVSWAYTGKSGIWGGLVDPDQVGTDKPIRARDQDFLIFYFHGCILS